MDIQFPPFLQKGDKVVIVSPSSKIDKQFLKGAKKRIESWGVKVVMGKHAGGSSGRYAGTISQRLKDLQDAMDDPKVKAILSSRGGYGAVHLIDKIDLRHFVNIRNGCWASVILLHCTICFRKTDMLRCIR